MPDLHAELWPAIKALSPAHRERFGLGTLDAGISRVRFAGAHYEPDEDGIGAVLFPVFDAPDPFEADLLDVVAWQPTSNQLATRAGLACALGRLDATLAMGTALRLYRSPLTWQGDPNGAVVVDWRAADLLLLNERQIVAEDIAHGTEIEARLRDIRRRLTPKMPQIMVASPG